MERVDLLIRNAAELLTCRGPADGVRGAPADPPECIRGGALAVRDGRIVGVGRSADLGSRFVPDRIVEAAGCLVTPGLVDPHTHLVHAGSRHAEWEGRVTGRAVPALAGGIRLTVEQTRAASDEELRRRAVADLDVMLAHGTTTVEAKTGYGLDRETELRLLGITAGLRHAVEVVPTYLGAHVPPFAHPTGRAAYVDLVVDALPEAAALAEYCDVCCDPVGFDEAECRRIAEAARRLGMGLRVHADQTGHAGGTRLAAELGAASADHLEHAGDADIAALAASRTVAVLLPGVTHHLLEASPELPGRVRRLLDAGVRVALATDYNPGTCPTRSLQAVMQLAARLYRLSYAEVWLLVTLNAAAALDRGHDRGSLEPGKRADVVVWQVPEHGMVVNRFGTNLVGTVVVGGRVAWSMMPG